MRDESAADATGLTAVSRMNPFAALAACSPELVKYASESEAKITETVDRETQHGPSLSEQRRTLEGRHAIALAELRREHDSALQIQKQQMDIERDNALHEQKQKLESERDVVLQEQKAQFEQKLEEEREFAGELLMRETEGNDFTLQQVLNWITKASQYFGFELSEDIDPICKVEQFALLARLNTSRMCQAAFNELSHRLKVPLERWPSVSEFSYQEHTDEYKALLTSQVDRIVQACDDRIGTEQCRTTDVQRASLISKIEVTEQASNAIGDLRAQIAAKDKLWGQLVTSLEACLAAKDQQIDALTERLRLQTQMLDERHALLVQMVGTAAASGG